MTKTRRLMGDGLIGNNLETVFWECPGRCGHIHASELKGNNDTNGHTCPRCGCSSGMWVPEAWAPDALRAQHALYTSWMRQYYDQ